MSQALLNRHPRESGGPAIPRDWFCRRSWMPAFADMTGKIAFVVALALPLLPGSLPGRAAGGERLPVIGPAPPFTLTSQDGRVVSLADLSGKIVAVSFIYTSCPDICPMLTQK